ncbi:hypothetical protein [Streptomyces sp. NPDC060187]|uniref:hypothetical protein n=1 Tax=Streptomyces sp. NPDC060187 TaxID=3347067 RepID=UPI003659FE7F
MDRDTLIRRWYVHRIRLESEGTTRRVRIGTEAFARPTEWFALDECAITERGLSTPAVERIVEAHQAPTTAVWSPGKARKLPAPDARAQALLRRLLYARRVNSVPMAQEVCGEIAQLPGVSPDLQDQLAAAVRGAQGWLEDQMAARRALFARLDSAVRRSAPTGPAACADCLPRSMRRPLTAVPRPRQRSWRERPSTTTASMPPPVRR